MTVSEEGWELLKNENIPTRGIPIMLVVDGDVSYGAWLWNVLSSSVCDGVSFIFSKSSEEKILIISQASGINSERRIPNSLKTE